MTKLSFEVTAPPWYVVSTPNNSVNVIIIINLWISLSGEMMQMLHNLPKDKGQGKQEVRLRMHSAIYCTQSEYKCMPFVFTPIGEIKRTKVSIKGTWLSDIGSLLDFSAWRARV